MMFGPNTPEQTRAYLEEQCVRETAEEPRMHYNLAIMRLDTGKVIGGISFHMNWRRDDAILGMVLNRHENGRGFMTEALRGVLDLAFGELGLHRMHAVCDVDNEPMQRVFAKVGMRNEGRMVKRGKSRPEAKEPYFDQFGYAVLVTHLNETGNVLTGGMPLEEFTAAFDRAVLSDCPWKTFRV